MNRFSNVPLLRLAIPFALGIIGSGFIMGSDFLNYYWISLFALIPFLGICWALKSRNYYSFGALIYLCFLLAGVVYKQQFKEKLKRTGDFAERCAWVGKIESISPKSNGVKSYLVKIQSFKEDSIWKQESFYVNFQSRDSSNLLIEGDVISGKSAIKKYAKPLNPFQFDYAAFMANREIYYYAHEDRFTKHLNQSSLKNKIDKLRKELIVAFHQMQIKEEGLAVLIALTLGDKSQLSLELKQSYAAAGAMHILAVSGLHVGIIFLLFNYILRHLSKLKWQRTLRAIILLTVVWSFALITGFSPSVQRAACMFSFVIVAKALNRHSNILNSIAGSALVLMLMNPNVINEIGFQLSYAAVIGIVLIYPVLYRCFISKYWLIDKVWSLTVVSIAATLATLPFSLYYFHQFPNWFFLTNLFVIPLAFAIVAGGALLIVVWTIFQKDFFLARIMDFLLGLLNEITNTVSSLPGAKTEDIWLSPFSMLTLVLAIGFLTAYLHIINRKLFLYSLLMIAATLSIEFAIQLKQLNRQFIGFYALKGTPISAINGLRAEVLSSQPLIGFSQKQIKDHLRAIGVEEIDWYTYENVGTANYFTYSKSDGAELTQIFDFRSIKISSEQDSLYVPEHKNIAWFMDSPKSLKLMENKDTVQRIIVAFDFPIWHLKKVQLENKPNVHLIRKTGYLQLNR